MLSFPVPVLGFLMVSFRPALLRSRSCSTGDPLLVFPPGPVPDFRILSSASVLASHYSASVSSFPPSPLLPHSGFRSSRLRSRFPGFPFLSGLISRAFLPGSRTRLSVCFLSSFLASLPQLFHECLPSAFAFGLFPFLPVSFVPDRSGSDYSALCSSFPFLPVSASQWLPQRSALTFVPAAFPRFVLPDFSCFPSRFRYSAFCSFPFALP